jgi:antibiotic biosynthesis monooxygenase (ABM) superfamily enzyme
VKFIQHIVVWADDPDALRSLLDDWNEQGAPDAPGYLGGSLLGFRDKPGRYVIVAEFDSWENAQANSDRPDTKAWAARLREVITKEPKYENLDVLATHRV